MKIKIMNMPFSYNGKEYAEGEVFEVPDKFLQALENTPAVIFEIVGGAPKKEEKQIII